MNDRFAEGLQDLDQLKVGALTPANAINMLPRLADLSKIAAQPTKRTGLKALISVGTRIVDSLAGVVFGALGGAIMGAGSGMSAGVQAGVTSLANDPFTIHYDYSKQRGYTIVGEDMHNSMRNQDGSLNVEEIKKMLQEIQTVLGE